MGVDVKRVVPNAGVPADFPGQVMPAGNGGNIVISKLDELVNWSRANSLWPLTFATSCCAIEMMATGAAKYDLERFGCGAFMATPRRADLMIVAGTVTLKMATRIKTLYEQMAEPKYVISMGACASSGGFYRAYHVMQGIDKVIPVDVYVPGCPPRPESLFYGLIQLQRKIKVEKFLGNKQR